jgi:imidazoleglycerol-phosphate dehydratase
MTTRSATLTRETRETSITIALDLDGSGKAAVNTGIPFLDHMLNHIARHASFDLAVTARGDLEIDDHHSVEDTGLLLGRVFREALGDGRGIVRMAHADVPMDEALVSAAVDLSGRPYPVIQLPLETGMLGTMGADMVRHFLESFAFEARCNLHVRCLYGTNSHHVAEAAFKAVARALGAATRIEPRITGEVPSTKGTVT